MVTKKHKKIRTPTLPPYLFPKFYHFQCLPLSKYALKEIFYFCHCATFGGGFCCLVISVWISPAPTDRAEIACAPISSTADQAGCMQSCLQYIDRRYINISIHCTQDPQFLQWCRVLSIYLLMLTFSNTSGICEICWASISIEYQSPMYCAFCHLNI